MKGWSVKIEPKNREYKGWCLYQSQGNEWSCAKIGWSEKEYDTNTYYMPVEKTQAKVRQWIDKNKDRF